MKQRSSRVVVGIVLTIVLAIVGLVGCKSGDAVKAGDGSGKVDLAQKQQSMKQDMEKNMQGKKDEPGA